MKHERAVPLAAVPSKNFLDAKQRRQRFPAIFRNATAECRMRLRGAANLRGEFLKWYPVPGGFLVEENEVLNWIDGNAITSSAQLPTDYHGGRYAHLEAARDKARAKRVASA